jgi:hypothetical protein
MSEYFALQAFIDIHGETYFHGFDSPLGDGLGDGES